jgi:hypothetical protein
MLMNLHTTRRPPLLLALGVLLVMGTTGRADDAQPDEVTRGIREHFMTVTREVDRYARLTTYGEPLSAGAISKDALAREVALFNDVVAAGMLKSPTDDVLALGHNLVVHDPDHAGAAYLKALHDSARPTDERVGRAFVVATLAAGEPGEAMAVAALASDDRDRRAFWGGHLQRYAIYASSSKPILARVAAEADPVVRASLIRSLSTIGAPDSTAAVKDLVARATDDEVQAAALYAYTELAGFDGIEYVEGVKPIGPKSTAERADGLAFLKQETRPASKHGRTVTNDAAFVARFGDLRASPAIRWLDEQGLLKDAAVKEPPRLAADQKKQLLNALVESRGLGLEACKGSLFRDLTKEDEPLLLRIRSVSFYSPNAMSAGRANTIGILVRQLRQQ